MVLLRDQAWPQQEQSCCWRRRLHTTLRAAGATVTEVVCPPVRQSAASRLPDRLVKWLPGRLAAASRNRATKATARLLPGLDRADLVVAESPATAAAAAAHGVRPERLWLVTAPPTRLAAGDASPYAMSLTQTAPLLCGFLTMDEPGRESVERLLCSDRPTVALLPAPGDHLREHQRTAQQLLTSVTGKRSSPRAPRRVLVSGFDLKFATDLAQRLDRRADLTVTLDEWPRLESPVPQTSRRLRRADAILAEWARPSAAWLSRHKRPGQFLVVRLHRYELDSPHPRCIAIDNVDAVVYIAPLFGRRIRDELGWPTDRLVYIPNYLDLAWFDRPKLPQARFTLGFVGMEVARKRFDLALDLLATLRRQDARYAMRVRSVLPWHNPHVWVKPQERAYVAQCFTRIEEDPLLRNGVIFDEPGRDMARWYRQVGIVLSTSDQEGSHTAVAEAMASGAVPVVRSWPGADEVYGKEWLYTTGDEAVAAVLKCADEQVRAAGASRAKAEVSRSHDPAAVSSAWADLLHGDLTAARSHFDVHADVLATTIHQERTAR